MNEQQEQDVAELNRHAEYYTSHHPNSDVGMLLRRFLTHVKELEQKRDAALKLAEKWESDDYGTLFSDFSNELRAIFEPKEGK